ncbi:MAG: hypothetical protein C0418_01140 [Coriobacteriaceae bacterium]|nr:hypothetical protein [Coriobacteriaceae bacterium]
MECTEVTERQKILIVDDKKENLVALRQVLSGVDAEIIEAATGNQALAATLDHEFAVAILDVQMPGMNGYELAEHLRGDKSTPVMPIVFLTASDEDERRMFEAYEAGGVDYMTKPYMPEILLGKVKIFLEMDCNRRELEAYRDRLETLVAERTAELENRVTESDCLYAVSSLVAEPGKPIEEALRGAVDLIPSGWRYPDITRARIVLEGREYASEGFRETPWRFSSDIVVSGRTVGAVEVCCLDEGSALDGGLFLKEEGLLLDALAERLGQVIQRKRAEKALRESSERFDLAVKGTNDGIWDWDIETATNYFSPRFLELLDYGPGELTHELATWESLLHPDDQARALESTRQHLEERVPHDMEYRMRAKSGQYRWFRARGQAIWDGSGKPLRMAGSVTDITERKAAEDELARHREHLEELVEARTKELAQANAELDQANEELQATNEELVEATAAKDEFLAGMSHELRTPLNSVIGFSGLLLSGAAGLLNDEQRKQIGMISSSGHHLLGLINDILDIARVESRQVVLTPQVLDPGEVMAEVVDSIRPLADEKGLELRSEVTAGVGSFLGDRRLVAQVLTNLCANAVKYTDAGGVGVQCRACRQGGFEYEVTDTGPGIPKKDLERIFDRFVRLERHGDTLQSGTGLGLALAALLAREHGGDITVRSVVGEGSVFTARFAPCPSQGA